MSNTDPLVIELAKPEYAGLSDEDAAAIARWQKARDAVDEGILADEQARVNQ